jgi:hypothetical protein
VSARVEDDWPAPAHGEPRAVRAEAQVIELTRATMTVFPGRDARRRRRRSRVCRVDEAHCAVDVDERQRALVGAEVEV